MGEVILEGVGKTYDGSVEAVRDFDLHVADGEFVVLVGPSGCGKTTTLRMIAGLESLTAGTIRIGDRVVNDVQPKDRDVAMVFQDFALYPHMTVLKNLSFALKMRKVPKDEIAQRVGDVAEMLGLSELLGRKPRALSGGQRQRVAVGRAIVRNPQVYLFDEPLSNLDAKLRTQTRAELKALHMRLGTTSVYVTHDQEEAMTLGQRLVVMAEGRIQQVGPPLEVYRQPTNRFVAGFVGSPGMNLVDGVVARSNGRAEFRAGETLRVPLAADPAAADGEAVVLGFRPEHLRPVLSGAEGAVRTQVEVTEPLGDRVDVFVDAGGTRLIARLDASVACRPGESLTLAVDPGRVHLFAPGPFGARLT